MKEIKFRAWNTKKKEMIYQSGDFFAYGEGKTYYRSCGWGDMKRKVMRFQEYNGILMEFIGLFDKNGKEIYEGDVLLFPDTESDYVDVGLGPNCMEKVAEQEIGNIAEVIFKNGAFGIDVKENEYFGDSRFYTFEEILRDWDEEFMQTVEVIGNIYENPELLEMKK